MEVAFRIDTNKHLIKQIKFGNAKEKQIAESRFYEKYAGYIYKITLQGSSNFSDPEFIAKEVVQKTFIKAFEYISNFELKEGLSDIEAIKIIKAWLGNIGNKVFLSTIGIFENEQTRFKHLEIEKLNLVDGCNNQISSQISNVFMQKLHAALGDLKEKDQHIILTYASEGCIDNTRHLSDNAMNFLCSVYETTSANIRQRKKRALDKIKKKCFEETK